MDLAGRYLVVWLSPEAVETFLGVLEPTQERAMTWTVAVGEAGPGLWIRLKPVGMPDGRELPLHKGPGLLPPVGARRDGPATTRCRRTSGGSGERGSHANGVDKGLETNP